MYYGGYYWMYWVPDIYFSYNRYGDLPACAASIASRTASEIWSQILSGCPSVTDSDVKRYFDI